MIFISTIFSFLPKIISIHKKTKQKRKIFMVVIFSGHKRIALFLIVFPFFDAMRQITEHCTFSLFGQIILSILQSFITVNVLHAYIVQLSRITIKRIIISALLFQQRNKLFCIYLILLHKKKERP